MKNLLLPLLFFCALAPAQTPAPAKPALAACAFHSPREWKTRMVARLVKPYGLLSEDGQGNPILVHAPGEAALPAPVTSTPCLAHNGDTIYILTPAQVHALLAPAK